MGEEKPPCGPVAEASGATEQDTCPAAKMEGCDKHLEVMTLRRSGPDYPDLVRSTEHTTVIIRGPAAAAAIGIGSPCDSWITGSRRNGRARHQLPASTGRLALAGSADWATQRFRFRPWSAQHGLRRPIRPEAAATDELISGVRRYCQAIFQDNRQLCNWAGAGEQLVARRRPVAYRRSALPRLACALPTDRKQPVAGETSKLTECARDHGLINNRRARKHPEHPKPRAALTGRGEVAICGETAWAFQCAPDLVGRGKAAS